MHLQGEDSNKSLRRFDGLMVLFYIDNDIDLSSDQLFGLIVDFEDKCTQADGIAHLFFEDMRCAINKFPKNRIESNSTILNL